MASAAHSISADSAAARQRHVDLLVATYAPLGRRHRRSVLHKRFAVLIALSVFIAAGAAMLLTDAQILVSSKSDDQRFGELRDLLTAELSAVSAEHQELEQYRLLFEERSDLLSTQIAEVNAQWTDLEAQRRQFETQSALLADTISDIDSERQHSEQWRDPGKMLDREITAPFVG